VSADRNKGSPGPSPQTKRARVWPSFKKLLYLYQKGLYKTADMAPKEEKKGKSRSKSVISIVLRGSFGV